MALTGRDGIATTATGAAVTLYSLDLAGNGVPGLSGTRPLAAVVVVLGMAACGAAGDERRAPASPLTTGIMSGLGALALGAAVAAIAAGTAVALAVLVAVTVVMWAVTTLRHGFAGPPPAVSDPAVVERRPLEHTR